MGGTGRDPLGPGSLRWRTGRERPEDEVAEEFAHHLDSLRHDLVAQGMSPDEARVEAFRRFGNVERLSRETEMIDRDAIGRRRRSERVGAFFRELRLSARALRRSPGFSVAAVLTLGLGLGATTAIYALLDAVVLRPLPYPEAERLVQVGSLLPGLGADQRWGMSEAGYYHFREHARAFESLGMMSTMEVTVTGDFEATRVRAGVVTASLFQVLGVTPALGRAFQDEEEREDGPRTAILGWDYWQTRFGGEPVVGRTIEVFGAPREIVGVMGEGVHLPTQRVDLWLPQVTDPARSPVNYHWVSAVGRLRSGVDIEAAAAEAGHLTGRFTTVFPEAYSDGFIEEYGFSTYVSSLHREVVGPTGRTLWVLLGSVSLVLVIAVANVANLFLVRVEARRREVAVRGALGADRNDLALHFLGESALVAAGALAVAFAFALVLIRALVATAPPGFPRLDQVGITSGSVVATLLAALVVAVGFGFGPLLRSTPSGVPEGGSRFTTSRGRRAVRGAFVVTQTALAVVLLAAAGLMLQSHRHLRAVEPGFDPAGAVTFQLSIPSASYPSWTSTFEFHRELIARIEALPGVATAGITTGLPPVTPSGCAALAFEDRPMQPGEQPPCESGAMASPDLFRTLGMRISGTPSGWTEMATGSAGVVVTRAFADRFWPGQDPIGKGLRGNGDTPPFYRVVGVVEGVRAHGIDEPPSRIVYFPLLPIEGAPLWVPPRSVHVVVRSEGPPPITLVPALRGVVAALDPDIAVASPRTMGEVVAGSEAMTRRSFLLVILAVAGSMALLLSAIGLFGVISYMVAQRRQELGIRLALGADGRRVRGLVVRQSMTLVAVGLVLGMACALVGTRTLTSLLFEVSPTDPLTLGAVSLVLLGTAALASWLPARRASRIDPMRAMRTE